jgi:magnesium-transporting ATPase (P-type)
MTAPAQSSERRNRHDNHRERHRVTPRSGDPSSHPVVSQSPASGVRVEQPHALPADEVLSALRSGPDGLTAAEAARRLEAIGPNRLPDSPKEGLLARFFKHFHDLLIYILIAAAAVTAALGHWIDTGVILAVVLINALIGFIQEGKAEQALEGIRRMLSLHAHVRRDGAWQEIEAEGLVPGDVVRLRSGDRVPADIRLSRP